MWSTSFSFVTPKHISVWGFLVVFGESCLSDLEERGTERGLMSWEPQEPLNHEVGERADTEYWRHARLNTSFFLSLGCDSSFFATVTAKALGFLPQLAWQTVDLVLVLSVFWSHTHCLTSQQLLPLQSPLLAPGGVVGKNILKASPSPWLGRRDPNFFLDIEYRS